MDIDNLNKVFVWSPIPGLGRLHKQANGNTLKNNGVAVFAQSMIWHYSKNYRPKKSKAFSLILCTTTDDEIRVDEFLDAAAKKVNDELLARVYQSEEMPVILPVGIEFEEGK